jgi:hypothetical protein
MGITVGVKSLREAEHYFAAGADEVYCGLAGLRNNRLPFENFSRVSEVEALLGLADRLGRRVLLAANVVQRESDYPAALRLLARLKERGLYGIIVRDPALLARLNREKFRLFRVLSTLANCFNSSALDFYARLGVDRLVLPMQLMPENAAGLIRNRHGVEIEAFCPALYYGVNVDSRCELPCPQDGRTCAPPRGEYTCLLPYRSAGGTFRMPLPPPDYTLGAFYDLYKLGVRRFKVARWPNARRQADVFAKVKAFVAQLEGGISRGAFVKKGLLVDSKPLQYGQSYTLKPL